MSLNDLIDRANALCVEDRIRLVQAIWESISPEARVIDLPPERTAELGRRLADLRADPQIGLTWEQVKALVKGGR